MQASRYIFANHISTKVQLIVISFISCILLLLLFIIIISICYAYMYVLPHLPMIGMLSDAGGILPSKINSCTKKAMKILMPVIQICNAQTVLSFMKPSQGIMFSWSHEIYLPFPLFPNIIMYINTACLLCSLFPYIVFVPIWSTVINANVPLLPPKLWEGLINANV